MRSSKEHLKPFYNSFQKTKVGRQFDASVYWLEKLLEMILKNLCKDEKFSINV